MRGRAGGLARSSCDLPRDRVTQQRTVTGQIRAAVRGTVGGRSASDLDGCRYPEVVCAAFRVITVRTVSLSGTCPPSPTGAPGFGCALPQPKPGQDCQDAAVMFGGVGQVEFAEDGADVAVDGLLAQVQLGGDLSVA